MIQRGYAVERDSQGTYRVIEEDLRSTSTLDIATSLVAGLTELQAHAVAGAIEGALRRFRADNGLPAVGALRAQAEDPCGDYKTENDVNPMSRPRRGGT